jgi:hypothetical protein
MPTPICNSDTYGLWGPSQDTICIPVHPEGLPEKIQVQGLDLYLPNPFHVSLVYIGQLIEKYDINIPNFKDKVVDDFCDFIRTNPMSITRYKNDEYRLASRGGDKTTVVVMCEVSNLNQFFDLLNHRYGLGLKYPAPHVTLYNTLKGQPGMYLLDKDDLRNFTVPIENPLGYPLKVGLQ